MFMWSFGVTSNNYAIRFLLVLAVAYLTSLGISLTAKNDGGFFLKKL